MSHQDTLEKHDTASAYIFNQDAGIWKILLLHHKKFNLWMVPGGHVESHENQHEAVLREVFEETGLKIKVISPESLKPQQIKLFNDAEELPLPVAIHQQKIENMEGMEDHYHLDFMYFAVVDDNQVILEAEKSHDINWFSIDQIDRLPIFESTLFYAKKFLTDLQNLPKINS